MIHASIRKNLAQSYRPQLNEGSIYTITNFLLEENKVNYRPVYNKFKILFNSTTSVSKFSGFDHSIPQSQFEFADYGTMATRCYDPTYLTGNFNCFTNQASTFTELKKNAIYNLILTLFFFFLNVFLLDVIGILDYIGAIEEVKTRGRPTKLRNIQLLLEE